MERVYEGISSGGCGWEGRWVRRRGHHRNLQSCQGTSGPLHTYLTSILHVVLLSGMRADPGAGAGCALFGATQDDGILVQVSSPLHRDTDRPGLLTDVIATDT